MKRFHPIHESKTFLAGVALCLCIIALPFCKPEHLPLLTAIVGALLVYVRERTKEKELPTDDCEQCDKYQKKLNSDEARKWHEK